jgi:hypothetical protein
VCNKTYYYYYYYYVLLLLHKKERKRDMKTDRQREMSSSSSSLLLLLLLLYYYYYFNSDIIITAYKVTVLLFVWRSREDLGFQTALLTPSNAARHTKHRCIIIKEEKSALALSLCAYFELSLAT